MKRVIYSILTLAALGSIGWLSVDIAGVVHARKVVAERIRQLPRIEVSDLSGRRMTTSAKHDQPTVLLFFRTTCPYCREEIQDLVAHEELLDEARVLLVSGERPGILRRFVAVAEIETRTDFTVAIDENGDLASHYGIRKIPALFVYDREGSLVGQYDGLVRAPAVVDMLKKAGHVGAP